MTFTFTLGFAWWWVIALVLVILGIYHSNRRNDPWGLGLLMFGMPCYVGAIGVVLGHFL